MSIDWVGDIGDDDDPGVWRGLCAGHGEVFRAAGGMAPDHDDVLAALLEHALWEHGVDLELRDQDWATLDAAPEFAERR